MVSYNENMKLVWYGNGEIEIEENIEDDKKWHFYFRNIYELVDLIKTNLDLAKELKHQLSMVDFTFNKNKE